MNLLYVVVSWKLFIIPIMMIAYILYLIIERSRRENHEVLADGLGMTYMEGGDDERLAGKLSKFFAIRKGRWKSMRHVMSKEEEGLSITICDWEYASEGVPEIVHAQTLFLFESSLFEVPNFVIESPTRFGRVSLKDLEHIGFVPMAETKNTFCLCAEPKDLVKTLPTSVRTLIQKSDALNIEYHQGRLLFYEPRGRLKTNEIKSKLITYLNVAKELITR